MLGHSIRQQKNAGCVYSYTRGKNVADRSEKLGAKQNTILCKWVRQGEKMSDKESS